jgi:hypothetical protein
LTDWMIDKELSRRVAPRLVSWAAQDIVNASRISQRFWLANGLIANTPGGGGKSFSLCQARAGEGVLLHPEGTVSWHAEHIAPLHSGAIDMAMSLAHALDADDDPRPVFVVPMVWRLRFTSNAAAGLIREMDYIERACKLTVWRSRQPAERLAALLSGLLAQRSKQLELPHAAIAEALPYPQYFTAQAIILDDIRARLSSAYGAIPHDPMHALRTIRRAIRRREGADAAQATRDLALMTEFQRLSRLDPALYGRSTLTQEQIAEVLKATRVAVVTSGLRNTIHNNFLPRAVAPRIAHIRVTDPIDIRKAIASGTSAAVLTERLRRWLQAAQDALGYELDTTIRRFHLPNPMAVRQPVIAPNNRVVHESAEFSVSAR